MKNIDTIQALCTTHGKRSQTSSKTLPVTKISVRGDMGDDGSQRSGYHIMPDPYNTVSQQPSYETPDLYSTKSLRVEQPKLYNPPNEHQTISHIYTPNKVQQLPVTLAQSDSVNRTSPVQARDRHSPTKYVTCCGCKALASDSQQSWMSKVLGYITCHRTVNIDEHEMDLSGRTNRAGYGNGPSFC